MSSAEVFGAKLETKPIFIDFTVKNGSLAPDFLRIQLCEF